MSEVNGPANDASSSEYESPKIEQVVTREGFEREVAYAGVIINSEVEGPN